MILSRSISPWTFSWPTAVSIARVKRSRSSVLATAAFRAIQSFATSASPAWEHLFPCGETSPHGDANGASLLEQSRTICFLDRDTSAFFERMFPALRDRIRICPQDMGPAASWNGRGRRLGLMPLDQSSTDLDFVLSPGTRFQTIGSRHGVDGVGTNVR